MTDEEFVQWLEDGQVVVVGPAVKNLDDTFSIDIETYSPCQARDSRDCLYCPWERCFRPAITSR